MDLPKKLPTPYNLYPQREDLFIEMGIGEKGLKYEKTIYKTMVKASQDKRISKKLTYVEKPTGNNCNEPDLAFTHNDIIINLEIKSKIGDPMGNFSLVHELGSEDFDLSNDSLDAHDKESLSSFFAEKLDSIDAYIRFAKKQNPVTYNGKINQFPMYISKEGADAARTKGLAKNIANYSQKDEVDFHMVSGLYNNGKNTYYIQIGGYGLYCIGFDKYKLGVPKLEGTCVIEIRPFSSGVKERRDPETGKKVKVVSMGLRASPRMIDIKDKSPYTLENVDSIVQLFQ
jgi:hypothetical protein